MKMFMALLTVMNLGKQLTTQQQKLNIKFQLQLTTLIEVLKFVSLTKTAIMI